MDFLLAYSGLPLPLKNVIWIQEKKERRAKASQVTLSSSSKTNQATFSVLLNNTSSATAANQSSHDPPSNLLHPIMAFHQSLLQYSLKVLLLNCNILQCPRRNQQLL